MRKIILAVGMAMGLSSAMVACGGNACSDGAQEALDCYNAMKCDGITGDNAAALKTACETYKTTATTAVTAAKKVYDDNADTCTDALKTAAEGCTGKLKSDVPATGVLTGVCTCA